MSKGTKETKELDIELESIQTHNPVTINNKASTFWTDHSKKGSHTIAGLKLFYSNAYGGVKFMKGDSILFVVPTANIPQYKPKD